MRRKIYTSWSENLGEFTHLILYYRIDDVKFRVSQQRSISVNEMRIKLKMSERKKIYWENDDDDVRSSFENLHCRFWWKFSSMARHDRVRVKWKKFHINSTSSSSIEIQRSTITNKWSCNGKHWSNVDRKIIKLPTADDSEAFQHSVRKYCNHFHSFHRWCFLFSTHQWVIVEGFTFWRCQWFSSYCWDQSIFGYQTTHIRFQRAVERITTK